MSDNWIAIVPEDPNFVPDADTHAAALDLFRDIAPDSEEIEIKLSEKIQLFDCGANLDRIICPRCAQEISIDCWQHWMDDDHDGSGFLLKAYSTQCCNSTVRLDELRYERPQAFARFGIEAMNPHIGDLSDGQISEFQAILGTSLRTVYQHI
jgi:hypothetical protein